MLETVKKQLGAKILVIAFILLTIWWLILNLVGTSDISNNIFGGVYGFVAFFGAMYGFYTAQKWGGIRSLMGRSIVMFSIGLLLQEFGQIVYSVYTFFLHVEIPYPSLGDVGYFGSIFCYIYGVWLLLKVSGVKINVQTLLSRTQAIIFPVIMLGVGYFLFLRDYPFDWSNPLIIFLDFGYPLGEAVYISLAILTYLLSRKILGGIMRSKVLFILFALVVQFLADYLFLYLSRYGEASPGGIIDYMYLLAYFLMGFALIQLKTVVDKLNGKE